MRLWALLLLPLLLAPAGAAADEVDDASAVSFALTPATTVPFLASPLPVEVSARHAAGFELVLDTSSQDTSPFDVTALKKSPSEPPADGKVTERWTLTLVPLALGTTDFPALTWRLAGRGEQTAESPALTLEVQPPATVAKNPELMALRSPWAPPDWLLWVLAGLIAGALLSVLVYQTRRKAAAASEAARPLLPPEQEALEALDELEASGLWEQGDARAFYGRLSDILRRYLERRYAVPAAFLTTHDIARRLRRIEMDRGAAHGAREVLDACDLAKFAKYRPADEDKGRDAAKARRLFNAWTPPAAAAAQAPAAAPPAPPEEGA